MNTKAGDRLKALRMLMGLDQNEMAEILGIEPSRYKNVEAKKVRVAEDEFSAVCSRFPEYVHYLTYEGELDLEAMRRSQEALVKFAAAAIEAGKIPAGFFLEEKIK